MCIEHVCFVLAKMATLLASRYYQPQQQFDEGPRRHQVSKEEGQRWIPCTGTKWLRRKGSDVQSWTFCDKRRSAANKKWSWSIYINLTDMCIHLSCDNNFIIAITTTIIENNHMMFNLWYIISTWNYKFKSHSLLVHLQVTLEAIVTLWQPLKLWTARESLGGCKIEPGKLGMEGLEQIYWLLFMLIYDLQVGWFGNLFFFLICLIYIIWICWYPGPQAYVSNIL